MDRAPEAPTHIGRRVVAAKSRGTARLLLFVLAGVGALSAATCAKAPPKVVPVADTWETKLSWMLRLEDQRMLRPPAPQPPPPPVGKARQDSARASALEPPPPELLRLAADPDARVRRRAALAIGRVGLRDGVPALVALLADREPEVRQMAAFALGLIGSRDAAESLRAALQDPAPIVQGRAAEALGLIGDSGSASAIAALVTSQARTSGVALLEPDDQTYPQKPDIEAYRLGVYALARLKAWDALSRCVLDGAGKPTVQWWPVAYAVQRVEERRAVPALLGFLQGAGSVTRAFAAKGLGALKEPSAVALLIPLAEGFRTDARLAASSIRALGQIGSADAAPALRRLLATRDLDPTLRLEVIGALGAIRDRGAVDGLLDLLTDKWPPMRAEALRALHRIDPNQFLMALSGLDPDSHWSVRAALAPIVATLDPAIAAPRLSAMLRDPDKRVKPAVLSALAAAKVTGLDEILKQALQDDDVMVRAAAADAIGGAKLPGTEAALVDAYHAGQRDAGYQARAAALRALAAGNAATAILPLKEALGDKDWAVRVQAATLLRRLDPAFDPVPLMRPAPARMPAAYEDARLVAPVVSPHVFIDTDKGTIEIELLVVDAPLTAENFRRLAEQGFFTGIAIHRVVPNFVVQDGDNRGDGEGGPGYTIRDEINQVPYLRGTVGMALDWADTGGSQFFITVSPQPHLDARYTVFGRVVSGIDVVDRIQQWDVIRRVRVWDGRALVVK